MPRNGQERTRCGFYPVFAAVPDDAWPTGIIAMKSAIAIRHVAFEHLGTLGDVLAARSFRVRYLDAGITITDFDVEAPDLVVILGGPIAVYEVDQYPVLQQELEIIGQRLRARRPTLGICLGAQIMAAALGARVYPAAVKELGWGPIELTQSGSSSCLKELAASHYQVLHWHGDTFDLPEGGQLLARTAVVPHQAFRIGSHALALQFHPEVLDYEIEHWLIGHAHELASTKGVTPGSLRADTKRWGALLQTGAARCFHHWLDEAGL